MAAIDIPEPLSAPELGISSSVVIDITLRRALLEGETSTLELADHLAVSPVVLAEVVEELRHLRLLEVRGLEGLNYLVGLTDEGHSHARQRLTLSRYSSALPVSLEQYTAVVHGQYKRADIHRDTVREALADLVVDDQLLDLLGPAIRSEGAMFLYGLPGTGKSAIAERLIRIHDDDILVPRAIEIDGQIVTVYDPVIHHALDPQPDKLDRRWVRCRRPSVIVGGELTAAQLDLTYEPHAGIYQAPIQMLANNGILVIDDFGRQQLTPEQLLNRWIVPLDRGVDYLSVESGVKFELPFLAKIVFCTNLPPATLADEAFYRRIRSKVLIPVIGDDQFDEVLRQASSATGVTVTPDAPAHLREASRQQGHGDLRPYLPGAVCELVVAIAGYESRPPVLDRAMVDRVVELFFAQDRDLLGFDEAERHAAVLN